MKVKQLNIWLALLCLLGSFLCSEDSARAQTEPIYSQYYLNPIVINPGFTGFRNTLAFDLSVRKQWMGIEKAPSSIFLSAHSPINNSKTSLGLVLQRNQAGPLSYNILNLNYSYIVRLGDRTLLSLGLDFGVMNQSLSFGNMVLLDQDDPNFAQTSYNQIIPIVGLGGVLFTPNFYFGIARPNIPVSQMNLGEANVSSPKFIGTYNFMAGASTPQIFKLQAKLSFLGRKAKNEKFLLSNSFQLFYKNIVGVGITLTPSHSKSYLMRLQINRNMGITYTYSISKPNAGYEEKPSHEITLSFDSYTFFKKNKNRTFIGKKSGDDEDGYRSIRYF